MTDAARPRRGPMTEEELRAAWVREPPEHGQGPGDRPRPGWPRLYRREAERIRAVLGRWCGGSTSGRPRSWSGRQADRRRPAGRARLADEPAYVPDLEAAGYVLVIREPGWFQHRAFKGPDTDVNLHVYSPGCQEIERYLLFRDRLRASPRTGRATSGPSASWPSGTGPTSSSTPTPASGTTEQRRQRGGCNAKVNGDRGGDPRRPGRGRDRGRGLQRRGRRGSPAGPERRRRPGGQGRRGTATGGATAAGSASRSG